MDRERRIAEYLKKYEVIDKLPESLPEYQELLIRRGQIREDFPHGKGRCFG